MKLLDFKFLIFFVFVLLLTNGSIVLLYSAEISQNKEKKFFPKEGQDYFILDNADKSKLNTKDINVTEFFWYGCHHCYSLDIEISKWKALLPKNVLFKSIPIYVTEGIWKNHAQLYYTIRSLINEDKQFFSLNHAIFDAIQNKKNNLAKPADMAKFVSEHSNITKEIFLERYHSFGLKTFMNESKTETIKYQLDGVPVIIINQYYSIIGYHDLNDMLKTANFLIDKLNLSNLN